MAFGTSNYMGAGSSNPFNKYRGRQSVPPQNGPMPASWSGMAVNSGSNPPSWATQWNRMPSKAGMVSSPTYNPPIVDESYKPVSQSTYEPAPMDQSQWYTPAMDPNSSFNQPNVSHGTGDNSSVGEPGPDMNMGYDQSQWYTPAMDPNSVYNQPGPDTSSTGSPSNQSPNFNFSMDDLLKYMGDTAMPTMDQIQMDPGYKWQQEQGINALDSSAAAHGGLLSSGHSKDILDYSQGLASQEYQNAFNRFSDNRKFKADRLRDAYDILSGDRKYGADRYDTGFNQDMQNRLADTTDYQYADKAARDTYNSQNDNWMKLLQNAFGNQKDVANYGSNAVGKGVEMTSDLATALANLGMSQAQIQALTTMSASQANRGTASDIMGLLGMLLGGGK